MTRTLSSWRTATNAKLRATPRLIIQVDSVPYKCNLDQGAATVDLVLLDEVESILRQMAGGLYPPRMWNALTWLATNSTKVLALDGLADVATSRFFDCIHRPLTPAAPTAAQGRPFWRMNTGVVKQGREYIIEREEKKVLQLIGHCLKGGKNICFASTSKKKLMNVCKAILTRWALPKSDILQVHSNTDLEVKEEALKDLQAFCEKHRCRVLAFSPTITAGCDISTYEFEVIVIYVSSMSITWHDIWQMLRRVRNPKRAVIWLASTMPKDPHKLFRVSEAYTRYRLRATELSHQVLARFGATCAGVNDKSLAELKALCRGDKSLIWRVITTVFNMRDNSMKDIEPQLRRLIELTRGKVIEGVPDEYLTEDYGVSDKTGTFAAYKKECHILSTTAEITDDEGEALRHNKQHASLQNQTEVQQLHRWNLQQTYGTFFRHEERWYVLYNATEARRKFRFVKYAVRKLKATPYHSGNTTQDRLGSTVVQAAKAHKVDEMLGSRTRHADGASALRELPYVTCLDYVVGVLKLLGFKEGIFSKRPVRVSEAQALEAFEYLHDYADKYPDNKDYKRTNLTSALRRATSEEISSAAPRQAASQLCIKSRARATTRSYWRRKDVCGWVIKMVSKSLDHITGLTLSYTVDCSVNECAIEGFHRGEYYPAKDAGKPPAELALKPIWDGCLPADLLT